ncbi:TadE/TadG family type IV pilus assembly protein [Sphingomicrobium arenosum]|uniref:TadE/TadG family type IV pilus assembly protein n=1 Tax=Sphingomicrobium arenosum TaxID=2233861 RepID=UPI002240F97D|nr:TadE/TadG family type IV pilus assembly protein [Sphingomicrobium arenosum]
MSRQGLLCALRRDTRGASAVEFALVLPLLLLLLMGIIDAGRWMWEANRAEKATMMGARYLAVTDPVLEGLADHGFATEPGTPLSGGDVVPTSYFGKAVCTSASCSCTGSECGDFGLDNTAFAGLVEHMALYDPAVGAANVVVTYENVGLGFAGDPSGSDVQPLITVSLTGMSFRPLVSALFPVSLPFGSFASAITAEDMSGTVSN